MCWKTGDNTNSSGFLFVYLLISWSETYFVLELVFLPVNLRDPFNLFNAWVASRFCCCYCLSVETSLWNYNTTKLNLHPGCFVSLFLTILLCQVVPKITSVKLEWFKLTCFTMLFKSAYLGCCWITCAYLSFLSRIWYQVFVFLNCKCCWDLLDVIKVGANMTSWWGHCTYWRVAAAQQFRSKSENSIGVGTQGRLKDCRICRL